jgi:glycerophosphoryl diester phosphodiesterase
VVGMSFDPDQVLALREKIPALPRGIIAERTYHEADWPETTPAQRRGMLHLRHAFRTRPHFVAYRVDDLPAPAPWIARNIFGLPLLTWTVLTPEQRARAARYADQMIFEGFLPGT